MPRRRLLLVLCAIGLAAFLLRVAVAARYQGLSAPPDAESNPDQIDYEGIAWRVATGEGYALDGGEATARRPPGTSWVLAVPYGLFGRDFAAARIWFCLLSSATCVVTGLLAAELFGALAGAIAAALLALLPGHFYYAMHFLSEVPYGLLIALACLCACRSLDGPAAPRTWALDLGAGALYGFAILTRPQVAFAGPIALALAALAPRALRGRRLRQVATIGVVSALVVAPWLLRNHVQLGRATLSTIGGFTFWGANNAVIAADPRLAGGWMPVDTLVDAAHPLEGDEVARNDAAWSYGLEFLRTHRAEVPRLLGRKLVRHFSAFQPTDNRAVYWSFAFAWLALLPFLAAGCVIGLRRRRAATMLLLLPILSTLVTAIVFYGLIRFRDADAALYVVPAAAALAVLASRVDSGAWQPPPATTSSSGSTSR